MTIEYESIPPGVEASERYIGEPVRLVRRIDGTALPLAEILGSIVLPSEGPGPAFLTYQNYRAFFRWNRSHFFAITLGHLADRIAGHGSLER